MTSTITTTIGLTSNFTVPSSCFGPIFTLSPKGNDVLSIYSPYGFSTMTAITRGGLTNCYPSDYLSVSKGSNATLTKDGVPSVIVYQSYYSPALCPVGHMNVQQHVVGLVTSAVCCPSGKQPIEVKNYCYDKIGGSVTVVNGSSTITPYIDNVYESAVTVAWQSSDLSLWFPRSPSTASATTTATTTTPATGTPQPSSNDISKGATVGIGVGIGFGILFIGAATAFWYWRRRQPRGTAKLVPQDDWDDNAAANAYRNAGFPPSELEAPPKGLPELDHDGARTEIGSEGHWIEMETNGQPTEMGNDTQRVEMPG